MAKASKTHFTLLPLLFTLATPALSLKAPCSSECEGEFHFLSIDFHIIVIHTIGGLGGKKKHDYKMW